MTVEEFAQMRTTDTEDFELAEEELVPLPSGTPLHAKPHSPVERLIGRRLEQNSAGAVFVEIDCRLLNRTVRRRDLSVFLGERAAGNLEALEYLAAWTREVWTLDHANREAFVQTGAEIRLFRDEDRIASKALPGFSPGVNELLGSPA